MIRPRVRLGRRRWPRSSRLAVGLAAVSVILAGCVNLPSGGLIRKVNPLPNSVGSQLVITPRAPGPQWQPQQIVSGFLVASGANPNDLSIARDYLDQKYRTAWQHPRSTPQVIDSNPKVVWTQAPTHVTGGQSSAQVTVTSQHLETLVPAGTSEAGRLQVPRGPAPYVFKFELVQADGGKWRIDSIIEPNGKATNSILLLTASDFERDYLPRNLYYLASGSAQTLVPYPVYIPAQTGQLGSVQQLVNAVRTLPPTKSDWLYSAIRTAFPPGTKVAAQVNGNNAVVSLSGTAARVDAGTLEAMEAQLVWTLAYAPDSPGGTGISSVEIDVGHRSITNLTPSQPQFTSWIPEGQAGPLYYQTLDQTGHPRLEDFTPSPKFGSPNIGKTGEAHGLVGGASKPEPRPAGLGRGPFTAIAVSPASARGVNYFAGCRGKRVYVAPLLVITDLQSANLPSNCTSLSWDNQGDLWAVAGSDVYVLNATITGLQVIPVSIPAQQLAQSDKFVSLKVAPDGLRVAMIVRGKHNASVYVSAITKRGNSSIVYLAQGGPVLTVGPDLVNPIALTWWNSDHLLVLERQHGVAQLDEVPVNGGVSTKVLTPSAATTVTANGSFVAVGTPVSAGPGHPTMWVSHGLEGPWVPVASAGTPTYVG